MNQSRHGWGCTPNAAAAVNYLSAAASNAAEIEQLALQAGLKKGGAAKGELVLAIFELANCFRHGWGIPKDPIAAKQVSLLIVSSRVMKRSFAYRPDGGWVSAESHYRRDPVTDMVLQYYETAANLGDTGELLAMVDIPSASEDED